MSTAPDRTRPLAGLRVVELARILAGPWIGQTLADLGAEVIKVESPGGDDTRTWGPPFIERPDGHGGYERTGRLLPRANRGKRSVTCDFIDQADLARLKALIADADVLIENFKVGGLKVRPGLRVPCCPAIRGSSIAPSPVSAKRGPARLRPVTTS